ncbi:MAG: hypothetical protein K6V73_00385 [Firmicutes bacterium]|nr:hypothetical protein [Bacillota bacterium]
MSGDQAEGLRRRVRESRPQRLGLWAGAGVDPEALARALTEALRAVGGEGVVVAPVAPAQGAAAAVVATRPDPESLAVAYTALGSEGRVGPVGLILVAAPGYPGGPRAAAAVRATAWQFRQVRVVDLGTLPAAAAAEGYGPSARTALLTAARRLLAVQWEGAP